MVNKKVLAVLENCWEIDIDNFETPVKYDYQMVNVKITLARIRCNTKRLEQLLKDIAANY